ncbi:hypothetical protein ACUXPM_004576 [Ralstonia sp. 151470066-2]|jgi:hypothetical protein|nr:hypothetical protein AC240_16660 [Ralstonia sp. MD27]MBA9858066.1 hypothetical protein [Ralstonia insidiosa]MBA9871931.1 hypothetical protein [Ralstonia insidiosa]MBA9915068.1 hypothetical protein [Ralstonia insidiosa]MBA9938347.1 hypothetical protein [Ralstonia insidiosa]
MAVTDRERARRGGCIRIDAWYPAVSARSGQAVDEPDEQVGIAAYAEYFRVEPEPVRVGVLVEGAAALAVGWGWIVPEVAPS